MMKYAMLLLLPMLLGLVTCEKLTEPVVSQELVALEPAAVMVTEAWLRIRGGRPDPALQVVLERDGVAIRQLNGLRDTVLADSGLEPAHQYTYRLRVYQGKKKIGSTPALKVATMDTTRHEIEWTVYEIPSPFGSGALYDVAIINENDIWAVGEIYADSVKPYMRYNATHWDGNGWELKRITLKFRSTYITPPGESIYAFSEKDIWVTLGGAPAHWDGKDWILFHLWDLGILGPTDGGVTQIWGRSTDDIYFVGRGGTIVHYDGQRWQRIESGTKLDIQDIWGSKNPLTGTFEILAVASRLDNGSTSRLLRITPDGVETLPVTGLSWSIKTLWFEAGQIYYIGGDGIYISHTLGPRWSRKKDFPNLYKHRIRGLGANDVFVVGSYGLLAHFNGVSWRYYSGNQLPAAAYRGVAVSPKKVVAVGYHGRDAIVVVGHRL